MCLRRKNMKVFKNLYAYRELLKTSVQKEIRGKYKGAWLGVLWSLLNPLLMLAVYSIIFPYILKTTGIDNYTMWLFVALLPWTAFTSTVTQSTFCIIANGNIVKKVYFPREIIPISIVTSGIVNYLITSVIMFLFLIISGIGISVYTLLFPVIVLIMYLVLLAIAFILSAITVYVRDLEHLVSLALLVLFYATPIVYTMDLLPKNISWILNINPMTHIISAFREILYYKQLPNMMNLGILAIVAIIGVGIGYTIFKRLERNFAEEL